MFDQSKEEVKLEWMYKGAHSTVDREEYLVGRSVDKTLDHLNEEEKQQKAGVVIQQPKNHVEHECIPPSIRDYRQQTGDQVDLTAKLQEDPLIAIKKREDDNRRQFLNNPIQIKKLQKALKSQKKSKKKKKKKDRNSDSDSEDDLDKKLARKLKLLKGNSSTDLQSKAPTKKSKEETNLDTILMHKYNQLKGKLSDDDLRNILQGKASDSDSESEAESESDHYKTKNWKNVKQNISGSYDDVSKSGEDKSKTGRIRRLRSNSRERYKKNFKGLCSYKRSRSRSPTRNKYNIEDRRNRWNLNRNDDEDLHSKGKQKLKNVRYRNDSREFQSKPGFSKNTKSDSSSDSDTITKKTNVKRSKRSASSSSTESDSNTRLRKKNWGLVKADGSKIPLQSKFAKDASSNIHSQRKLAETIVTEKPKRVVLTEEEKERKRKEMMENATWRDLERTSTVKRYREKEMKEEQVQKDYNPKFLQKELLKSANNSSVESRIKANINNIQRSGNDMNRHFSKR